jgi:ATP-dependent RNA helicase DDX21
MTFGWLRLTIAVAMLLLGSVRSWKNLCPMGLAIRTAKLVNTPSTLISPAQSVVVRLHSNHRSRNNGRKSMSMRDFRGNDRFYDNRRGGADPFARLTFKRTVKIDPDVTTAVAEMTFSETTMKVLQQKGFAKMTPVQSQAYEYVHSGADVVARSRTGTGKTFAFGVPLIEKIVATGQHRRRTEGSGLPVVLILEPTRELAIQVSQELSALCKPHRLRIMSVYGGSSYATQENAFREGVHIVVSTPGRLLDHIREGTIDLSHVEHVVLDEGDTMLEMGFQKDVESILMNVKVPGESSREKAARALETRDSNSNKWDRNAAATFDVDVDLKDAVKPVQLLLFSATMPGWICQLTDKMMKDPIFLDAVQEGETRLASTITHYALPIQSGPGERLINTISGLIEDIILTKGEGGQTIVFTNTKEDADILVNSDCFGRLKAQVLHGDISQATRQTTLKQFKDGSIDVLVATDVAARGLDIAGVELVIHTAPPNDADSYVHRSGRTGRAGRSGTSVLLYTNADLSRLKQFERSLNFQFTRIAAPSVAELASASSAFSVKQMSLVEDEVIEHFRPYAKDLIAKAQAGQLFDPAVIDLARSHTTDPDSIDSQHMNATAVESLIARCIAAISNRMTIPSRYEHHA